MASTHPLVERFRQGDVPAPLKGAAARGALPLPPEDLLEILFHLRQETSKELQQDIVRTIGDIPDGTIEEVAKSADTGQQMLDFLARACVKRDTVVEKVVLNPATADPTILLLAQHGSTSILELIALNQVRLTRAPAIIQAILKSQRATLAIRRRLQEIWELHGQQAKRATGASAPAAAPVEAAPAAGAEPVPVPEPSVTQSEAVPAAAEPLPTQADSAPAAPGAPAPVEGAATESPAADDPGAAVAESGESGDLDDLGDLESAGLDEQILAEMEDEDVSQEQLKLAQRLLNMSVPERVQLATKGNREARNVLIRDASKQVQNAVLDSPKITENEIEKISNLRSVSEDILRKIANNREFTKSYAISHGLVKNPKTPPPVAMQLMTKLQGRDLQMIAKDRNIPDLIRRHALITLEKRKPKKVPTKK